MGTGSGRVPVEPDEGARGKHEQRKIQPPERVQSQVPSRSRGGKNEEAQEEGQRMGQMPA